MEELAATLKKLENILGSTDWAQAPLAARTEVINLLIVCSPVMGDYALEAWAKKVAVAFGITSRDVLAVLKDPVVNVSKLVHSTPGKPLSKTPYPKDGWLAEYLAYTTNNEAPTPFHFWTGVGVIGGCLSREVHFDKAHYRVYPNHFLVLVAPSGRCRKSTAISIGVKLLRDLEDINIIAEKITPEALLGALTRNKTIVEAIAQANGNHCAGFIHAPELAVFLGKQMYNEGMVALLTGLSDNPDKWDYETKNKAVVKLTNVNISMLGASTPDWLYDSIPQSAFGGGFMSRILFVVQQSTDRVLPFPPPADSVRRTWLMKKLRLFQRLDTPFILTDGGKEFYKDWYNEIGKVKLACEDQRLAGYFERKPDHLIRLAMVLSVARGEALELTAGLFQEAIAILDTLEVPMPDAFTSFGEAVFGANARRVVNHLSSTVDGKMEHSTLLQKNIRYMDKRSFQTCIDTLIEAKMIDTTVLNRKRYYILLSPKED